MRDRKTDDIAKMSWTHPADEPPVVAAGEDLGVGHYDDNTFSADDEAQGGDKAKDARAGVTPDKPVAFHYPQPTPLREVLQAVAAWSDLNFVMDPSLNNRPIQIFAPRKIAKEDAFQLFVASLETIGLRALHLQGKVVKIVPMAPSKLAV